LQIDYGWTNGGSIDTLYGEVRLITQGGSKTALFLVFLTFDFHFSFVFEAPNRVTRSRILFNNNLASVFYKWYADPTPAVNKDDFFLYKSYSLKVIDPDNGSLRGYLNNGRTWTADETSLAYNRTDLLTIAIHELGHCLGMDGQNLLYLQQLNTKRSLSFEKKSGATAREPSSTLYGPIALTHLVRFLRFHSFFSLILDRIR
jgi:hypothetical protein